jgi:hypothetical protein
MEYLVIYIAPKEKKMLLDYIGGARDPRGWSVPPNPFG